MPKLKLEQLQNEKNIADLLDEQELADIGQQVLAGYKIDEDSLSTRKETLSEAMKIAMQVIEAKNTPWENASNVKFPLISKAAINYSSRTIPEIISNDRIVKCATIGNDPNSDKFKRAQRVSKYMSYQTLVESEEWEDNTDQLLIVLSVVGTVFRKSFFDTEEERLCTEFCTPDNVIVNLNTQSLKLATRITHLFQRDANYVIERQRSGIYLDSVDIESLKSPDYATQDMNPPLDLGEQHCWLDLDDDGYKEPYVVVFHKQTGTVLRIVNRFDEVKTEGNKVIKITAENYFTDYHFIRAPDGGFYSIGFGTLLLPINSAINTIINQLINAGTLATNQCGFLGKGLRIQGGDFKLKLGEWKVVQSSTGISLKDNIVPLPVNEPSQTLFNLLGLLINMCNDLTSITDVLQGKQPAQNVASGTISTLVEQGTKIFVAINKRVYRSLKNEFERYYKLNYKYLSNSKYRRILDDDMADKRKDFDVKSMDIRPVADPTLSSDNQRLNKAIFVQQLPTVDRRAADFFMLQSLGLDDTQIQQLLPPTDPNAPPPPEVQKIQAEIQQIMADIATKTAEKTLEAEQNQIKMADLQQQMKESEARIQESMARIVKMAEDSAINKAKIEIAASKMQSQEGAKGIEMAHKEEMDAIDATVKLNDSDTNRLKVVLDAHQQHEEMKMKDKEKPSNEKD